MKKLLTLSLCAAMIIISSCSEDSQLRKPAPELDKTKQIAGFFEKVMQQNLSRTEIDTKLDAFLLSIGGRRVTDPLLLKEFSDRAAGKEAPGCQFGSITYYFFPDGSSVGVQPFEDCDVSAYCNGEGGWVLYERSTSGGDATESVVCAADAS